MVYNLQNSKTQCVDNFMNFEKEPTMNIEKVHVLASACRLNFSILISEKRFILQVATHLNTVYANAHMK